MSTLQSRENAVKNVFSIQAVPVFMLAEIHFLLRENECFPNEALS